MVSVKSAATHGLPTTLCWPQEVDVRGPTKIYPSTEDVLAA